MTSFISNSEAYNIDESKSKGESEGVFIPDNSDDIKKILQRARQEIFKITVCGNRTGVCGGSVPHGGYVISTERLNRIIGIGNDDGYYIRVQPCVTVRQLSDALLTKHLGNIEDLTTEAELRAAVLVVEDGETIVLGADITLEDDEALVIDGKDCAIDLNGHSITGTGKSQEVGVIKLTEGASVLLTDYSNGVKGTVESTLTDNKNYPTISVVDSALVVDGGVHIVSCRSSRTGRRKRAHCRNAGRCPRYSGRQAIGQPPRRSIVGLFSR